MQIRFQLLVVYGLNTFIFHQAIHATDYVYFLWCILLGDEITHQTPIIYFNFKIRLINYDKPVIQSGELQLKEIYMYKQHISY